MSVIRPRGATRAPACFALLLSFAGCAGESPDAAPATEPSALNIDAIAGVIAERLALQPGERVLLVGTRGRFDALVPALRRAVVQAGGEDLGAWAEEGPTPAAWETDFIRHLGETRSDRLVEVLGDVDAAVMLPGATPAHRIYGAMQDVLRSGRGRTVHFHWAGAYNLDGTEREVDTRVDRLYQRALLETDYDALAAHQRAFEEAMRSAEVRVTTRAGTDLRFRIGDRPVTRQDGDASAARAAAARNLIDREIELPAGAIRVAPVEETVRGRIAFPPSVWQGERVEGLVLTFEAGRVVALEAVRGLEAVRSEMEEAGDAARAFREFALGFNPLLAIPDEEPRWIPYYGYGAGVVRLSLGDNTELGGSVGGGYVRWNFFTDASVTVGDELWVDGGRLIR